MDAGDSPKILTDMLFRNPSRRDLDALGVGDRMPEDPLRHKASLGVMPQCPMAEVCEHHLAFVEPVVDRLVILRLASPLLG